MAHKIEGWLGTWLVLRSAAILFFNGPRAPTASVSSGLLRIKRATCTRSSTFYSYYSVTHRFINSALGLFCSLAKNIPFNSRSIRAMYFTLFPRKRHLLDWTFRCKRIAPIEFEKNKNCEGRKFAPKIPIQVFAYLITKALCLIFTRAEQ